MKTGTVKGQPQRFIPSHHKLKSADRYVVEDRAHTTLCWIWQGKKDQFGYGIGQYGERAHRQFFERYRGPIPTRADGSWIPLDHLCRQRDCVNPDHLEVVSRTESSRRRKGQKRKLSIVQVEEILALAPFMTRTAIARCYRVGVAQVSSIILDHAWHDEEGTA